MIGKNMWKIFEATGSIEAYLYVLQQNQMENAKREKLGRLKTVLSQERKINSM